MPSTLDKTQLILGNSNSKFSGVTSTMLQILEHQKSLIPTAVLGKHHLPEGTQTVSFWQLARLLRKNHPDGLPRIFHARRNDEALQALALKKLFGAKIRIAFTSTAQRNHSWITRWILEQSDTVITTSNKANSYIHIGADTIIPHGIDTARYAPADDKAQSWAELGYPGKHGIGIFGRVRPSKGIDLLVESAIKVLPHFPDYTVIICGETTKKHLPYQAQLEASIRRAGLAERILFIGKQPFDHLPKIMRCMALIAAVSRNEGFGLTVLEALASGVPVIASHAGAWQDIVTEALHGSLVPADDQTALNEKLRHLLSQSPDKLIEMGKNGRQHILDHYTIEREARQLTDFLQRLRQS